MLNCYRCSEPATEVGFSERAMWTPQEFVALCSAHASAERLWVPLQQNPREASSTGRFCQMQKSCERCGEPSRVQGYSLADEWTLKTDRCESCADLDPNFVSIR